jgi:hypothetical protein
MPLLAPLGRVTSGRKLAPGHILSGIPYPVGHGTYVHRYECEVAVRQSACGVMVVTYG